MRVRTHPRGIAYLSIPDDEGLFSCFDQSVDVTDLIILGDLQSVEERQDHQ